ncbi:MAG: protein of unknown function with transrane region, partial [Parcubacteria group bacterium]|nr:protein of unknown function with transrane region [Parcubacteria group bacterium]
APEPLIREAADFARASEPSLPSMPVVERVYAPVSAPGAPTPAPLHTYSGDFSDRIDQQKSSTFSVLAAQSDAGQTTVSNTRPRKTFIPLAAGVAMLIIGIGAIGGAYIFTHKNSGIGTALSVPSLIRFDESVEVKGTGADLMKAIANVAEGGSVSGNVVVAYVTGTDATTTSGIPQQGGTLIKALSLSAPDILLRNIDAESTVGTIRAGTESRPFLILKVSSYERTFAGMLAWEQTMPRDLSILYPTYTSLPAAQATTSSSTPVFAPVQSFTPAFTDGVVANYDVRVLRDASGRSLLIYGYKGKDLLIIARDEAAFTELVSRLTTAGT